MAIERSNLPPPDVAGFEVRKEGDDLIVTLGKHFDHARRSALWAVQIVRACPGPYARVVVDCSHQVGLTSTAIAGLVRLADEYTLPHDRHLLLLGANDRIRRLVAQIQLDRLIACIESLDPLP